MPYRSGIRNDLYAEQALNDAEQTAENLGLRKVLFYFVIREAVTGLLELLGNVGDVPGFCGFETEFRSSEFGQLGQVSYTVGLAR